MREIRYAGDMASCEDDAADSGSFSSTEENTTSASCFSAVKCQIDVGHDTMNMTEVSVTCRLPEEIWLTFISWAIVCMWPGAAADFRPR